MTLATGVWAIDGMTTQAVVARLQLQSATRSGNGVVESTDMIARPLDVPGQGIIVGDGAAVVLGREANKQGSYWIENLGDEQVSLTPTTSAGSRSDMVYLRVEDPTVDGTPWTWNPATDQCAYFRVWEGCPSTATDVPAGESGIPIARITRPASTGTIQASHITNLREMANPRSLVKVVTKQGVWPLNSDGTGGDPTSSGWPFTIGKTADINWVNWPYDNTFDVDVPPWATQVKLLFGWGQIQFIEGESVGEGQTRGADGNLRIKFGSVTTDPMRYLTSKDIPNYNRYSIVGADTLAIPAAMRGTSIEIAMQGKATSDSNGRVTTGLLQCDGGSSTYVEMVFEEVATTS